MKIKNKNYLLKTLNKGGMSFGTVVLLFVVIVFIIWVLNGGGQKQIVEPLDIDSMAPQVPTMYPN